MKLSELKQIIKEETQKILNEADKPRKPQDGDKFTFSANDRYSRPMWVKGNKIKVGNKGKAKDYPLKLAVPSKKESGKKELADYKPYFYVDIKDLGHSGYMRTADGNVSVWWLKNEKVDGKKVKYAAVDRSGRMIYYVE